MIYNYYKLSHLQGDDLLAEAMAYDNHSLPKQLKQILPDFEWKLLSSKDRQKQFTIVFKRTFFQGDSANAEVSVYDVGLLPDEYINQLPNFRPNEKLARSHIGITEGRFVHQAVGQIDPNVIFSRDVMHQNRPNKGSNLKSAKQSSKNNR